jgi:TonB dependent receptor-like, beta-barrel
MSAEKNRDVASALAATIVIAMSGFVPASAQEADRGTVVPVNLSDSPQLTEVADRVQLSADGFRIAYSNRQFSEIIPVFPFQISTTIASTRINGAELDSTILLSGSLRVGIGVSYIDAEVADHTAAPSTAKLQLSPTLDFTHPVFGDWSVLLHVDGRYNSSEYMLTGDQQYQEAVNLLNAWRGLQNDRYTITARRSQGRIEVKA